MRMSRGQRWRLVAGALVLSLGLAWGTAMGAMTPLWQEVAPREPLTLWLAAAPDSPAPEARRLLAAARLLLALLSEKDRVGVMAVSGGLRQVLPAEPLTASHRQAVLQKISLALSPGLPATPAAPRPAGGSELRGGRGVLVFLSVRASPEAKQEEAAKAARGAGLTPLWLSLGAGGKTGSSPSGPRVFAAASPELWAEACLELLDHLKAPECVPRQKQGFFLDATVARARWFLPAAPRHRPALIAPDGRVLPAGRPAPGLRWQAGEGYFLADMKDPAPGWWRVSAAAPDRWRCLVDSTAPLRVWLPAGPLTAHLRPWMAADWEGPGPLIFSLQWQRPDGTFRTLELTEPSSAPPSGLPTGARLGLLPQALAPGSWQVRVTATGPEAIRTRLFRLSVLPARGGLRAEGEGGLRLEVEDGPPGGWQGWLGLHSPASGWAGRFVRFSPRGGRLEPLTGLPPGSYLLASELWGAGAPGLPPVWRPAPVAFSLPALRAAPGLGPPASPSGLRAKVSRLLASRPSASAKSPARRLALGLAWAGLVGGLALLLALALMMRRAPETGAEEPPAASLLAGEQLQAILAERARLAAQVEELERALAQLSRENESLRQELEARSQAIQEKARLASQWQEEALKAQEEARLIQEEYTALYARSQRDKDALRRT